MQALGSHLSCRASSSMYLKELKFELNLQKLINQSFKHLLHTNTLMCDMSHEFVFFFHFEINAPDD